MNIFRAQNTHNFLRYFPHNFLRYFPHNFLRYFPRHCRISKNSAKNDKSVKSVQKSKKFLKKCVNFWKTQKRARKSLIVRLMICAPLLYFFLFGNFWVFVPILRGFRYAKIAQKKCVGNSVKNLRENCAEKLRGKIRKMRICTENFEELWIL